MQAEPVSLDADDGTFYAICKVNAMMLVWFLTLQGVCLDVGMVYARCKSHAMGVCHWSGGGVN